MILAPSIYSPRRRHASELENFQDEHQRLLRALSLSVEKELSLHSELRRLKDSVMRLTLQLNTALKVAQDDEILIHNLRKEAEDCRTEALSSKKQAEAASNIVNMLKMEVNALKKKLSDLQQFDHVSHTTSGKHSSLQRLNSMTHIVNGNGHSASLSHSNHTFESSSSSLLHNNTDHSNFGILCDHEVDEIFKKLEDIPMPSYVNESSEMTSFQKWKIHNFLYTADTPYASENHDSKAVEKLEEMLLKQSMDDIRNIPRVRTQTRSSAAKQKDSIHSMDEVSRNRTVSRGIMKNIGNNNEFEGSSVERVRAATAELRAKRNETREVHFDS